MQVGMFSKSSLTSNHGWSALGNSCPGIAGTMTAVAASSPTSTSSQLLDALQLLFQMIISGKGKLHLREKLQELSFQMIFQLPIIFVYTNHQGSLSDNRGESLSLPAIFRQS